MSIEAKQVSLDSAVFEIGPVDTIQEVFIVQRLDSAVWPEGYKHYVALWNEDSDSIIVAKNPRKEIASFVGVERIPRSEVGKNMPGWDHDPREWVTPDGDVWYITGHIVTEPYRRTGLSSEVIGHLSDVARVHPHIEQLAVMLRINHPTLGRASTFWEAHGFSRRDETYDPNWKASPRAKDSGGVIYSLDTKA